MENIQPWCISRQLWWGHQIPAWYGPDGKVFVALTEAEAVTDAKKHYGKDTPLARDEDVLDTWFSSALWPFSTLGWPDQTPELKRFYPTSALVTGFDIIFFWVARMMMMGLHFMKEVPFHTVYIHALVRDASGAKMSKSKGNVIDPLALIDEYGADALRFTLARNVAPGHDIRLGPQDVENNRNFATKLWNAARFAEMNGCATVEGFDPKSADETLNRWIAHETARAAAEITKAIETYAFSEAAGAAYRFVWNVYCDWYLELTKPVLMGAEGKAKSETRAMVAWVRDEILKLLHPFMPFITEELWQVTGRRKKLLALTAWPTQSENPTSWTNSFISRLQNVAFRKGWNFGGELSSHAEIGFVVGLIEEIRSARKEFEIAGGSVSLVRALNYRSRDKKLIVKYHKEIFRLSRTITNPYYSKLVISEDPDIPVSVILEAQRQELLDHVVLPYREGQLLLHGIDRVSQKSKYEKELQKLEADIARCDAKLNNPKFMERAAAEVVEEEKEKRAEAVGRKAKITEALERLKGAV